jgi:hypothetical protein
MEPRETSPKTVLIHEVRFYVPFGFCRFLFQLNMWTFRSSITLPTFHSVYRSFCRSAFSTELAWFSFVSGNKLCCEFLWCVIWSHMCESFILWVLWFDDDFLWNYVFLRSWIMVSFSETLLSDKRRWPRSGLVSLCLGMRLCCNQYYEIPGWSSSRSSPIITSRRVIDGPARCTTWKTVLKEQVSSPCSKFRMDAGEEVQQDS